MWLQRKRSLRLPWILLPALLGIGAAPAAEDPPPNFLLIVADDLGYADLGAYGGTRSRTPHLDRLAAQGIRFTDFHAMGPVCTPSRAALVTGRYPQRSNLEDLVRSGDRKGGLALSEVTFAEVLRAAGYRTALFGKWHLGNTAQFSPVLQGFDEFKGSAGGNVDYRSHLGPDDELDWWKQNELRDEPGYITHLTTEDAIDFVVRNREHPFLLVVSYQAPHAPAQGPYDPVQRSPAGLKDEEREAYLARMNAEIPEAPRGAALDDPFRAMVESLDAGVGRIVASLNELGLSERTFVMFLSDNGPTLGSASPFRGRKGGAWEGGHRVPAIARWLGHIEAGGVNGQLLSSMDLFPTMAKLAGAPLPANLELDGVDLAPTLFQQGPMPDRMLFWRYRDINMPLHRAVRKGPWKLLLAGGPPRLYNVGRDPAEKRTLTESEAERVAELKAAIEAWEQDVSPTRRRSWKPGNPIPGSK